ncbi:carboxymuconolactone decarboxylase family protein [Actinacidiphila acididurans]|uniref:Carboxymuconolactone decarboxylase family protein n=1 Tax=Actinacidiphila acididurans TaxID=2784346 RepID=A0ABS2U0Y1_9ACTN|nr:carboxymuconolactone decarboxylase family protein [Actinacidiphila acididurans]MBM9509263.1 carboxymuconolactone decarboxylase family protein [Actinacidiphila acididurans]
MPRIPVHTVDNAPAASEQNLRTLEKKFGKVLNIHGGMAHSPVVLATYTAIQGAIAEHGTFDARTREAIALAVGAVDDCSYCQAAHTVGAKAAGFTEEETVAIRRGDADVESKLAALLEVAREVAGEVGEVSDATWDKALAAGWTDVELTEVFAHVAVNLYTNYFNHLARTDLDLPAAPALA